jgi:ATP-dependent Clp protease ATP-binding subunit ClpA
VFDRFDDHALAALQDAQAQAIGLGHNYVGTEHLLLGIVINPDTTASHLLTAAGVDAEVIRRGIAKVVPIPDRPFRDPAPLLSTLGIDLDEVRRRAESTFGADTVRRVAVQEAHRRRRDRRFRFRRCVPIAPSPLGLDPLGFTPRAKHTLELAAKEADQRHPPATPTHLLLGILIEGKGLACDILADADVSLPDLTTAARTALDQRPGPAATA